MCNQIFCSEEGTVTMEKKCGTLNSLAALVAMSMGSGFSQEDEKFSIMNIEYMSRKTYGKCEKAS